MNKYELLWDYQQADMAVDSMKRKIAKSPVRIKLLKLRESIQEKQELIKKLEEEMLAMLDRLDVIEEAISLNEGKLRQAQDKIQSNPAQGSDDAKKYVDSVKELLADISNYEEEIKRIKKDSADRISRQRASKKTTIASKNEFDSLKEGYNVEYKESSEELEKLKSIADEKAKLLDSETLNFYKDKKQRCNPPLAKLVIDRCGGCNMTFSSSLMLEIQAGKIVECENCGRVIIP